MANIIIAQPHGFCFGVSRAIEIAQKTAKNSNKSVFMLGELVHNQHVADWLESDLKIKTVQSLNEIPPNSIVIIRAHGAAPKIFQEAKNKGLEIIDASCPLVLKSHQIVKDLSAKKKDIVFLCNKVDHDETIGVVGEAPEFIVPVTLTDIYDLKIKSPGNTFVITQTTLSTLETKKVLEYLKKKYPKINIIPHICQATTERQESIIKLARKNHFVIIVGSPTSANSNNLKSVAENSDAQSYIVDNALELKKEWFVDQKNIVVSSGASTPEDVLDEVIEKIEGFTRQ